MGLGQGQCPQGQGHSQSRLFGCQMISRIAQKGDTVTRSRRGPDPLDSDSKLGVSLRKFPLKYKGLINEKTKNRQTPEN